MSPTTDLPEPLVKVSQLARLLNESVQTTYRRLQRGEIPYVPIGTRKLIRQADVERLLREGTPHPSISEHG